MNTTLDQTGGGDHVPSPADVHTALKAHRKRIPYYYEGTGREHDDLVRCKDCGRLVTYQTLMRTGVTPCCGTRKTRQIQHLRFWEWLKVRLGILDFPNRDKFLREFSRGR
jgi:hypothetical protein